MSEKVIPLISRETSFSQHVSEMVFGVNIFDLDLGFQVDSCKQPIKSNSVSSRQMSHCGTSSFDYHFDHNFVVFENVQLKLTLRRLCVEEYVIHVAQLINLLFSLDMLGLGFGIKNCPSFLGASVVWVQYCLRLFVKLQSLCPKRSRASNPSIRSPASREMISDSVELCETEVCFLNIQLTGTKVLLPKVHKTPPAVDLESSSSPAKSESWKKPSLQCCAVFPT